MAAAALSAATQRRRLEFPVPNPIQWWAPDESERFNSTAFGQTEWIEWTSITITFGMNLTVALICLFFFWSMRQHSPGHFNHKRARLPGEML